MHHPYRAVLLDGDTLSTHALNLEALHTLLPNLTIYPTTTPDQCVERVRDADIVLTNKVVLDERVIDQTQQLQLICVLATGYNNIDIPAAKARNITVCNATSYSTASVVQLVFSMMLSHATHIHKYDALVNNNGWIDSPIFCRLDYPITELSGKILGIIGHGTLGQAVRRVAEAFGMRVLVAERKMPAIIRKDRVAFDDVVAQSDYLSLHCPLNDATRDIIHTDELRAMKQSAYLINTARGGVVNEAALAQALKDGEIAGAAVDVLSQEPPSSDHPLVCRDIPNLLLTPHIAWTSLEAQQRLVDITVQNLKGFMQSTPSNVVS